MAITKMDVLKDLLECMRVEDHVINNICKQVILNTGEKEEEERETEHKKVRDEAKEKSIDKKESLKNGDMSKLSKKEQRKLKRKMKKARIEEVSDDEEETPKEKKGSHLIPKEKIQYPQELLKHKELGSLLKKHEQGGEEGRKARKSMRKLGFKLSDQDTWKKFIKEVK